MEPDQEKVRKLARAQRWRSVRGGEFPEDLHATTLCMTQSELDRYVDESIGEISCDSLLAASGFVVRRGLIDGRGPDAFDSFRAE